MQLTSKMSLWNQSPHCLEAYWSGYYSRDLGESALDVKLEKAWIFGSFQLVYSLD